MLITFKKYASPEKAIVAVASVLKTFAPEYVFEYKFVDDKFNKIFETESLMGNLVSVFSFLAILISCLGLFGLASYTAEKRTKEISIRKILVPQSLRWQSCFPTNFCSWCLFLVFWHSHLHGGHFMPGYRIINIERPFNFGLLLQLA